MRAYIVKIKFIGLTGEYFSDVAVEARNEASAKKKAARSVGNRDGEVVSVREGMLVRVW
jgi:hypothetical protein